ncbi:MAG: hypothetical protein HKP28_07090 [Winogradskyella sp.]|nr:hypothetical protein [Winogradskyella sp.]
MIDFNFSGRPDGIGNRIEQIIMLEGVCTKKNIHGNYVWNNIYSNRSYNILFSAKSMKISKAPIEGLPYKWDENPEDQLFFSEFLDQEDILKAAKHINPRFNVYFNSTEKPIGIHIRGTDRIGSDHHHFMRDYKELNAYISKTIGRINLLKPKYVYVCSENEQYRNIFIKNLDKNIKIINPICDVSIPSEYRDFFALSKCQSIIMCSKFSSFSITASLIGNVPVISYVYDKKVLNRYKALFEYDLNFNNVKIRNYITDPAKSKKLLFKKYINKLKVSVYSIYKILLNTNRQ